jgi:hypothetical protein
MIDIFSSIKTKVCGLNNCFSSISHQKRRFVDEITWDTIDIFSFINLFEKKVCGLHVYKLSSSIYMVMPSTVLELCPLKNVKNTIKFLSDFELLVTYIILKHSRFVKKKITTWFIMIDLKFQVWLSCWFRDKIKIESSIIV